MIPTFCADQAPVPPPSYHQAIATALYLDGLTLATRLHLLEVCRVAVWLASPAAVFTSATRWSRRGTTTLH